MRNNKTSMSSLAGIALVVCLAVSSDALAQSAGRYAGGGSSGSGGYSGPGTGYRGYYGGPGAYYPAYAGYPSYGGSSSFATSAVSVSVGTGGGMSINIANVGAASSFTGFGGGLAYGGPWFGGSFAGIPGFTGGSAFNGNGVSGLNIQLGGGSQGGGGTNINIANVAFTSAYYWAPAVGYYYVPVRPLPTRRGPASPVATSGGNGEGGGGSGAGGADGAGDGGGAY